MPTRLNVVLTLVCALTSIQVGGCGSDRALGWEILVPGALEGQVAFVETTIADGACDSTGALRYSDEVQPGSDGSMPSTLPPGVYAFSATAIGQDCTPLATRCETHTLPLEDGETLTLSLEALTLPARCDPAECVAGRCASADAGDAGDAGTDAPLDTGTPITCDLGAATSAGCIVPSNVPEVTLGGLGDAELVVSVATTWVFRTDTGAIDAYMGTPADLDGVPNRVIRAPASGVVDGIGFSAAAQLGDDTRLGVFSMGRLQVPESAAIAGSGEAALVLLVGGEVLINGLVTVAAAPFDAAPGGTDWALMPGPGGAVGGTVCSEEGSPGAPGAGPGGGGFGGAAPGETYQSGGGGASCGGGGGTGGGGDLIAGAPAGSQYGNASLVPLLGGSGGGPGGEADCGRGGAGGGALQITAGRRIRISGRVDASGAGGGGGRGGSDPGAGGAGGSGGSVLLEAPALVVTGTVSANGGGGGAGGGGSLPDGNQASSGAHGSEGPAAAGGASRTLGGAGGNGSDTDGMAAPGGSSRDGGGGGGGGGRIRFNSDPGGEDLLGATLQPSGAAGLATNGAIERRR